MFANVVDALITALVVIMIYKMWKKTKRYFVRPVIYVVEDNETDIILLKIHTELERYDVRYFRELDGLAFQMALKKPDAVLVDYFLPNEQTGDKLFRFCDRNHIPVFLTTAYDGPIKGIDQRYIIKKTGDHSYYDQIDNCLKMVLA